MRKVITKKDACAVAYYVSEKIAKKRSLGRAKARFESNWDGRWHTTSYSISGEDFYVASGRTKHSDGRIRDAYSDADGLIHFAIYCVRHFPNIHPNVAVWADALQHRTLVAATLDDASARKIFASFMPGGRWSLTSLVREIKDAETLQRIAA